MTGKKSETQNMKYDLSPTSRSQQIESEIVRYIREKYITDSVMQIEEDKDESAPNSAPGNKYPRHVRNGLATLDENTKSFRVNLDSDQDSSKNRSSFIKVGSTRDKSPFTNSVGNGSNEKDLVIREIKCLQENSEKGIFNRTFSNLSLSKPNVLQEIDTNYETANLDIEDSDYFNRQSIPVGNIVRPSIQQMLYKKANNRVSGDLLDHISKLLTSKAPKSVIPSQRPQTCKSKPAKFISNSFVSQTDKYHIDLPENSSKRAIFDSRHQSMTIPSSTLKILPSVPFVENISYTDKKANIRHQAISSKQRTQNQSMDASLSNNQFKSFEALNKENISSQVNAAQNSGTLKMQMFEEMLKKQDQMLNLLCQNQQTIKTSRPIKQTQSRKTPTDRPATRCCDNTESIEVLQQENSMLKQQVSYLFKQQDDDRSLIIELHKRLENMERRLKTSSHY